MKKGQVYYINFYPRSPCGERRKCHKADRGQVCISIHALLAESDSCTAEADITLIDFYPRSPCGERRWNSRQATVRT